MALSNCILNPASGLVQPIPVFRGRIQVGECASCIRSKCSFDSNRKSWKKDEMLRRKDSCVFSVPNSSKAGFGCERFNRRRKSSRSLVSCSLIPLPSPSNPSPEHLYIVLFTSAVILLKEITIKMMNVVSRASPVDNSSDFGKIEAHSTSKTTPTTWLNQIRALKFQQQGIFALPLGVLSSAIASSPISKEAVATVVSELRGNPTFMSALIAWSLAQVLKVFTTYAVEKRWDPKMLTNSGGMPSSHSALCIALTTSVALLHGISGPLFPVCLGFSLIVMYDAIGVRYHAGVQAEVLNTIVADYFQSHPVSEKKLKELLGHTPLQVSAGALLGVVVTIFYFKKYALLP